MNRDQDPEKQVLAHWHKALEAHFSERERQAMWRWVCDAFETAHQKSTASVSATSLGDFVTANKIVERLLADEPLAYILGETEFYSLPFQVGPSVLIPRPETEELVEWISTAEGIRRDARVLDIGTGSGCIALALKHHHPSWTVTGCDISHEALTIARQNAGALKAEVRWLEMDILQEFPNGSYDIMISNPPYIPRSESGLMSASTLAFEPSGALFTDDADGLTFYRAIATAAQERLSDEGVLYFELNEFQAGRVERLLNDLGYTVEMRKDLQGKVRMARASKA